MTRINHKPIAGIVAGVLLALIAVGVAQSATVIRCQQRINNGSWTNVKGWAVGMACPPAATPTPSPTATPSPTPTATATATATASPTATPAPGAAHPRFGIFSEPFPWTAGTSEYAQYETTIGYKATYAHWFVQAAAQAAFSTYANAGHPGVTAACADGRVPLITLEMWDGNGQNPWSLASITNGSHDAYFVQWANGIKAEPCVVLLRPFHEMNLEYNPGNWGYPWCVIPANNCSNTPAQYVAAWRHVVDVMRAQGATNLRFVFNAGGDLAGNPLAAGTYPGSAYVDYIGADLYGSLDPAGSVASDAPRIRAIDATKPILNAEVGGNAAWINGSLAPYFRDAANVRAGQGPILVWFNQTPPETDTQAHFNASNMAALRAMLATP